MISALACYLVCTLLLVLQSSAGRLHSRQSPTECPTKRTYIAVSGDTCAKIATAHSVPRGSLIAINKVRPDCADLRVGQVLCLPEPCALYPVEIGMTCQDIVEQNLLTYEQLLEWNSYLDSGCTNLLAGDEVCVSPPAPLPSPTTSPAPSTLQKRVYATSIVDPPGPVPRGTTKNCGQYYEVKSGDYCDSIADRYSIDYQLFRDINPAIDAQCTNLIPGLYYCVSPTENWNQTATSTTATSAYATAPAPTTSGTTANCYEWYVVQSGDTCNRIAMSYSITIDDIRRWNPSVRADCSNLRSGRAYCVHGDPASPTTPMSTPAQATATPAM
ncbi:uncharacterized protein DSM5745_08639 [Aspergillus mulundensis]|uniref:LysM domain-containing protein n=1 Tax=Aspergillus mulundensis TaxID=1810919 RepID=A0A3D8R4D4_9EURO|nr:Uncharacterized protein DSM5745_08639 [Aspergillus mulundensis]RDW68879.1 Uncharacterized protein DSM5745_08639 [Aspergillus mulundensis]